MHHAMPDATVKAQVDRIRRFPDELEALVKPLDDAALDKKFEQEWTVRQIVHHLADSHMNSYIRVKLGLTQDTPTILPYDQDQWAELPDSGLPIEPSLSIIRGLHARWTTLFDSLTEAQWARTVRHPEYTDLLEMTDFTRVYADHCDIHIDQINRVLAG